MKVYTFLCLTFSILYGSATLLAQNKGMKPVNGTAPAGTERRLALVVGNRDYAYVGKLTNPLNDADDMAAALKKLGFEVILRKDLTQSNFLRTIDEFGDQLTRYDVGLFYYSGHGVQFNGENYLVPIDANAKTVNEIEYNCVKLGRTMAKMEGANLKVSLALLDACRDNPFPSETKSMMAKGFTIPNNPPGSFVAFSTRAGSFANDNSSQRNGLFTTELLRHLTTPDLGIRQIMDLTIKDVTSRSNRIQIPGRYDELTGDFVFVQTAAQPATNPKPIKVEATKPTTTKSFLNLPFSDMAYIEGGTFEMGSTGRTHTVTVSSFWMGKYEVTQGQWQKIMGSNPSEFKNCETCPVENVSWNDVQEFLKELNASTGGKYRLPTEAEWEYAAGGGATARTRFGNGMDILRPSEANFNSSENDFDGYSETGEPRKKTVKVGSFPKNRLGLYDMTGNVSEWCSDWAGLPYSNVPQTNPTGPFRGSDRVWRGGDWNNGPPASRVSYSGSSKPSGRFKDLGFRLVTSP